MTNKDKRQKCNGIKQDHSKKSTIVYSNIDVGIPVAAAPSDAVDT
jgi:hypothetical protein